MVRLRSQPVPWLGSLSRVAFGLSVAFFAVEDLRYHRFANVLPPAPIWTPGAPALPYLLGAVLLLAGIGVALAFRSAACALLVAILYLICGTVLYGLHPGQVLVDAGVRTGAFETLAISGAAFVLFQRLRRPSTLSPRPRLPAADVLGRALFAIAMLVFGEQHFQYIPFVASLIPAWIPFHVFFTCFTGAAFFAAALAIGFNRLRPLASNLLGAMFLSWFLLLHLPRVLHEPHNSDELISAVIALILAAASFLIAEDQACTALG